MSIYLVNRMVVAYSHTNRYYQIMDIYDSLNLDTGYRQATTNVFGDKRPYSWDKSRSQASSISYGHNDTPQNTANNLRKKIEAAGFKYVQTEYADSASPTQEYKNDDGNYIRVSTESAAVHNASIYGTPEASTLNEHFNDAPTYVTIKVNLDDNND